jgi:hypothetical protein
MLARRSALGRGFGVVVSLALHSLAPACALSEASAPVIESNRIEVVAAAEVVEIANPPLVIAEPEPSPEVPARCLGPEPSGRWAKRSSDDEWARGLYPAKERYPEGWP